MYMLNTEEYNEDKVHEVLDMLYLDKKNEFRELSEILLNR